MRKKHHYLYVMQMTTILRMIMHKMAGSNHRWYTMSKHQLQAHTTVLVLVIVTCRCGLTDTGCKQKHMCQPLLHLQVHMSSYST